MQKEPPLRATLFLFCVTVAQKHKGILIRPRGIKAILQPIKSLDLLRVFHPVFCQKANHFAPGHLAHGSLFDHFAVLFLAKHAGDKADMLR